MIGSRFAVSMTLLLAAGTVQAGMQEDDQAGPMFKQLDQDGNGRITQNEAKDNPALARHFDQFDANGDGVLTREEIRKHGQTDSSS